MKIELQTDEQLREPAITLQVPPDYPDADQLLTSLKKWCVQRATLAVSQRDRAVALPLTAIMFIEASGHQISVHTTTSVFRTTTSLTALSTQLPANFIRVSKSALVNVQAIYSLTKSLTGNLLTFNESPKQLYVSRRYYHQLKLTLETKGSIL